ncbi:MAG: 50S ribosomal protein L4 [Clostridia bacterium]|jgi:large subunit ribosomal protein L4|nr:50S ribosomal protein L4 [Clostridia bacterium]
MIVNVYNTDAKAVGKKELNEAIFGQAVNETLIHQVVVAQLANKRQGTKSTLTRSEVRGGGIKPWRQKGTGRARQGSIRSPQWIKGGVVFAPKPRDFSQKINAKMKKAAMVSALSAKVANNEFTVVDKIVIEAPKTRNVAAILKNFNFVDSRVLFVINSAKEETASILRAAKNIEKVNVIDVALLNVYDLLANKNCVITLSAVEKLQGEEDNK